MNIVRCDGLTTSEVTEILELICPVSMTSLVQSLELSESTMVDRAQEASIRVWRSYIAPRLDRSVKARDFLMNVTVDPRVREITIHLPLKNEKGKFDLVDFARVKAGWDWVELFYPRENGWSYLAPVAAALAKSKMRFRVDQFEAITAAALHAVCACHQAGIDPRVIIDMAQDGVI